ncbi:hypothetical protein D3C85_1844450 [compost metagenome]
MGRFIFSFILDGEGTIVDHAFLDAEQDCSAVGLAAAAFLRACENLVGGVGVEGVLLGEFLDGLSL